MISLKNCCFYIAAMALPALAIAQQEARPDPAEPKASVPPVLYVSPLTHYQPLRDEQVTSWKAANELVEKIGGWKIYANEAQAPAPAVDQSGSAPQIKPAPQGNHSGHQMQRERQ